MILKSLSLGRRFKCLRRYSSSVNDKFKVAVVGAGPAGFYTSQQILKTVANVEIDIYEKLPIPFGLVRYGVAPHHQDVKNCTNTFENILKDDRISFFGNISVGKDIVLSQLKQAYHAVVLSYGCELGKHLEIPGMHMKNVFAAKEFVEWYNGHPLQSNLNIDLSEVESAVIIGHGNVALDIASILLLPIAVLEKSDASDLALAELRRSKVKNVYVIGRRGPLQVSFTTKEVRDLVRIENCQTHIPREDIDHIKNDIPGLPRPQRRLMELLQKTALDNKDPAKEKNCHIMFKRSPVELFSSSGDNGSKSTKVSGIQLQINKLIECDGQVKAVPSNLNENLKCDLVVASIGYQGVPLDNNLPFDSASGILLNKKGRVSGMAGYYCSGWICHGPNGVIVQTMTRGQEIGQLISHDLTQYTLGKETDYNGRQDIYPMAKALGLNIITKSDWWKIDNYEKILGGTAGRPRVKLLAIDEMINKCM